MRLAAPEIHPLVPAIEAADILTCLGVTPGGSVRPRLRRLVDEVLELALEAANPQLVWRMGTTEAITEALSPSRRLDRYLEKPESAVLIAATAGPMMTASGSASRDSMKAYILGAAATAIARATLEQARRRIHQQFPGKKVADSLSPGTDGLPFKLQLEFFNILPAEAIGIRLDRESLLMSPLASVTSIIAWGDEVEREVPIEDCGMVHPRCERCPSKNCQLRIHPFTPRSEAV